MNMNKIQQAFTAALLESMGNIKLSDGGQYNVVENWNVDSPFAWRWTIDLRLFLVPVL